MGSTTSSTAGLPKPKSSSSVAQPDHAEASDRRGLLTGLASGNYGLTDAVGAGRPNRGQDVQVVENMLSRTGLLNRTPGKVFNDDTGQGIRKAQAEINKNFPQAVGRRPLNVDGWLRPDGPTAQATRAMARSTLKMDRDKTARPATDLLSFRQPKSRRPWWKAREFKEISGEAVAENGRQVTALTKTADFGDLPKYVADALENAGERGMAEVADLLRQFETLDPVRANELSGLTLERVSDATRGRVRDREDEQDDPPHRTLELRTRDKYNRPIDRSKDAMPLPHREGQVWDNGRWRDMTPEEARRPDKINLADSGAEETLSGGAEDGQVEKKLYPDLSKREGMKRWSEDADLRQRWTLDARKLVSGAFGKPDSEEFKGKASQLRLDIQKASFLHNLFYGRKSDVEKLRRQAVQVYGGRSRLKKFSSLRFTNGVLEQNDPKIRRKLINTEIFGARNDIPDNSRGFGGLSKFSRSRRDLRKR